MLPSFVVLKTENLIDLVSGRKRGLVPALVRSTLSMLTPMYRLAIFFRNRRFNNAHRGPHSDRIKSVDVPVISIGNLTTGGTGKTPHVIWIARLLRSHGVRVAIVSRGYGALRIGDAAGAVGGTSEASNTCIPSRNDEALELEFRLPDVPHLQSPNRFEMASTAVEELESQVILLDDGFQHRQLHRDLDIVLIDATNPFGYQRLLPRGLLREPVASLRRADVVIVTRCEKVDADTIDTILARVVCENNFALIAKTQMQPQVWLQFDGRSIALKNLYSQKVFAFCGIGNPLGFQQTLQQMNLHCVGHRVFADHYNFTRDDLESVSNEARLGGAEALVCTHKDLVKIGCNQILGLPVYALLIDVSFVSGQDKFAELVLKQVTV